MKTDVTFTGPLPREDLARLYQEHDILIFPPVWEEPFGITLLEAMASGLAVVATGTGGSIEILQDEENCLLFTKADGADCARQIRRLLQETGLLERIRAYGRATVEQRFNFGKTIDRIEQSLRRAVS